MGSLVSGGAATKRPDVAHVATLDPCVFVFSTSTAGRSSGMAATWITDVSHRPLVYGVSMREDLYTLALIRSSGWLTLSYASAPHEAAFDWFGMVSGAEPGVDKMARLGDYGHTVRWHQISNEIQLPLLDGAHANLVCKVHSISPCGGRYVMVCGEAVHREHAEHHPKLYYNGKTPAGERYYRTVV